MDTITTEFVVEETKSPRWRRLQPITDGDERGPIGPINVSAEIAPPVGSRVTQTLELSAEQPAKLKAA